MTRPGRRLGRRYVRAHLEALGKHAWLVRHNDEVLKLAGDRGGGHFADARAHRVASQAFEEGLMVVWCGVYVCGLCVSEEGSEGSGRATLGTI